MSPRGGTPRTQTHTRRRATCCCREYGTIDDVDIDLHVNISFLDVSPRGTGGIWWGGSRVPTSYLMSPWLSLGRRRWQQPGRCFGLSPSSCACASPSPSTSMAPVSGDGQSGDACVAVSTVLTSSSVPTEPSIEVFQPSNKEGFGLGLQLKK